MLSRVAESVYWMSRYIERAENTARFIDVNLQLSLDRVVDGPSQWRPMVSTTGDDELFEKLHEESSQRNVIQFLTFDRDNPNSIYSCLRWARENARSVREVISQEMWLLINRFYLMLNQARIEDALDHPHEFFGDIRQAGQHFTGVTDSSMSHGEGWNFSKLGRYLERADKTSRILDVKYYLLLPSVNDVGTTFDDIQWAALLRSASAFEMYRRKCGLLSPIKVVEYLLLDQEFPRAVLFCLSRANEALHDISGTQRGTFRNTAEKRLGQLEAELAFTHAREVIDRGLHEFVDDLQTRLNGIGQAISETFFAQRPYAEYAAMRRTGVPT